MGKEDDVMVLAKYESEIESNIVKGMLEAAGITAGVMGDTVANTLLKPLAGGEWKVVVRRQDLPQALQLLEANPIDNAE